MVTNEEESRQSAQLSMNEHITRGLPPELYPGPTRFVSLLSLIIAFHKPFSGSSLQRCERRAGDSWST